MTEMTFDRDIWHGVSSWPGRDQVRMSWSREENVPFSAESESETEKPSFDNVEEKQTCIGNK